MFFARRSVASTTRRLLRNQQPRRFDSHAAHSGHHAQPVNEGFGRSFYVSVGTFASAFVLYQFTKSGTEDSWIANLIQKWTPSEQVFEQRNAIRTVAMEKAAHDRHLFLSQGPRATYEVNQHEVIFNGGSPYNVAAGSGADLSDVAAHYEKEHKKMEEARVARMKDGKVVSLYD